ncbi:MAG: hypothetical protein ACK5LO_08365 [Leucobacter sp.]
MSAAMMDTSRIEHAVSKGAEYINPVALREALSKFCEENRLPFFEQVLPQYREDGTRIGPEMRISAEAATMLLEAGERLEREFRRYLTRLLPLPEPEPVEEPNPVACRYTWCDAIHPTAEDAASDYFHIEAGIDRDEDGVIRTDHVLQDGKLGISFVDEFDWHVDVEDSAAFFQKMRAAIDEAEQRFGAFVERVGRPLERHTEPGSPGLEDLQLPEVPC